MQMSNSLIGYENKWVALTPDRKRILASDKNFKKLSEKLDKMDIKRDNAILHFVLPFTYHSF